MWLSLVERCVRDAEVVGSNPAIPTIDRSAAGEAYIACLPLALLEVSVLQQFLMALGYGLCHQLPDRSFSAGGVQFPVCARDTGIYLGFMIGFLVIALLERRRRAIEPAPVWVLVLAALMVGAMAADGLTSYMGLRETTNDLRLATGLAAGFGLSVVITPILNGQLWRDARRERVLGRTSAALIWLGSLPAAYLLIRYAAPFAGVVYPLATAVAIIFTFLLVNLVIVTLLPSLERKALRLRDCWLPIAFAMILTLLELLAASWIRVLIERAL